MLSILVNGEGGSHYPLYVWKFVEISVDLKYLRIKKKLQVITGIGNTIKKFAFKLNIDHFNVITQAY